MNLQAGTVPSCCDLQYSYRQINGTGRVAVLSGCMSVCLCACVFVSAHVHKTQLTHIYQKKYIFLITRIFKLFNM